MSRETVFLPEESWQVVRELLTLFINEDFDTEVEGCTVTTSSRPDPENFRTLTRRAMNVGTRKRYFIDVRENDRGKFLRLSELKQHGHNSTVYLPFESFAGFKQILEEFSGIA